MSKKMYAFIPGIDEELDLEVGTHEGVATFKPEFVFHDGILGAEYLAEHGREYWEDPRNYEYDQYGYGSDVEINPGRFRSVRIFKVATGEKIVLQGGERWQGRVSDWTVSDRKSKDGRAIIYVTIRDLRRRYSFSRERDGNNLVIAQKCGDRVLRQRTIPLEERLYRFREKGDPTGTIFEIKALGTEQQPFGLVDLHFPRRTTLRELVEADVAVFEQRLRTPALQKAAAQNIQKTIRVVSSSMLEKHLKIPFVGKGSELNSVLGRR